MSSLSIQSSQSRCSSSQESSLSPHEMREELIRAGILPTPEEAKQTFWSLGSEWWRQIIDGEFHKHGPLVFDQGLHRGHVEPGYLEGVQKASEYFVDQFAQELTPQIYAKTHAIACAHFTRKEGNGICCNASEIDLYRSRAGKTTINPKVVKETSHLFDMQSLGDCIKTACQYSCARPEHITAAQEIIAAFDQQSCTEENLEALAKRLEVITPQLRLQIKAKMQENQEQLHTQFASIQKRLQLDHAIASTVLAHDGFLILYYGENNTQKISDQLLAEFNHNLFELQKVAYAKLQSGESVAQIKSEYLESVVPLIGQLYEEIEFTHPWIDGQGRVDLITLNGLLCREGSHPCFLNHPYFSTANPHDAWLVYLQQGLEDFEKFQANLKSTDA